MKLNRKVLLASLIPLAFGAGCGGGGGSSTPQTPSPYSAKVTGPTTVVSGQSSYASNWPQKGASYAWLLSGPGSGSAQRGNPSSFDYTAGSVGTITIKLTVTGTEPGGNNPVTGSLQVAVVAASGSIKASQQDALAGEALTLTPVYDGDMPELTWWDVEGRQGHLAIGASGEAVSFTPLAKTTFSLRFQNAQGETVGTDRVIAIR